MVCVCVCVCVCVHAYEVVCVSLVCVYGVCIWVCVKICRLKIGFVTCVVLYMVAKVCTCNSMCFHGISVRVCICCVYVLCVCVCVCVFPRIRNLGMR